MTLFAPHRTTTLPALSSGEAIQQLYAGLIDDQDFGRNNPAVWDDAELAWQQHQSYYVTQGQYDRGIFNRNSVQFRLGSQIGYSIQLGIDAPRGNENLELKLKPDSTEPAFTITPVPRQHDILRVRPARLGYTQLALPKAFDFKQIVTSAKYIRGTTNPAPWFAVSFRSKLKPGADNDALLEHDHRAYQAAKQSESLVYYYGDKRDKHTGWAHSFCLWENRAAAGIVSRDPTHLEAASLAREVYADFAVEKFAVHHTAGKVILEKLADNRS